MDIFNVPGHFLGLDYVHNKKPNAKINLALASLEAMAQKYENLIFWPTLTVRESPRYGDRP